jgi:membrane-bound lytic murein transglycosylase MltF
MARLKDETGRQPRPPIGPSVGMRTQGMMQPIPDSARRFEVRNVADPVQTMRGGTAWLRGLLA